MKKLAIKGWSLAHTEYDDDGFDKINRTMDKDASLNEHHLRDTVSYIFHKKRDADYFMARQARFFPDLNFEIIEVELKERGGKDG